MTTATPIHAPWERFQSALPSGVTIEDELHGSGAFGRVFRVKDSRAGAAEAVCRVVRFLEVKADSSQWHEPLRQRAALLLKESLPYVSTLREIGSTDDLLYLMHDYHPATLAELHPHKAMDAAGVQPIADQLLAGLAALHGMGISHGDLRRRNVFVSKQPDGNGFSGPIWIADPVIGSLTWWSQGALLDQEATHYYPPKWTGVAKEPSAKSDLYALGILLSELLLGPGALPSDRKPRHWTNLSSAVKRRSRSGRLHFLLSMLLAEEDERPESAVQVQKRMARRERAFRRWTFATMAAMFSVALLGLSMFAIAIRAAQEDLRTARTERDAARQAHENLQEKSDTEIQGLGARIAERNAQIAELKAQIAELKAQIEPDVPHLGLAIKLWRESNTGRTYEERLRSIQAQYEMLLGSMDPHERTQAEQIASWWQEYNGVFLDAQVWLKADAELKRLLNEAANDPAEPAGWQAVRNRRDSLRRAAGKWKTWADTELSVEEVDRRIRNETDSAVESILKKWLAAIDDHPTWTLRLKSGVAPPESDYQTYKVTANSISRTQDWSSATGHTYSGKSAEIEFAWEPHEEIRLYLEACGYVTNWNVIEDKIAGALAIWRLHSKGGETQDGFKLTWEVVNCPGPPKGWDAAL